jgi:hypothetical protein
VTWFVIAALCVWLIVQQRQIADLNARLSQLAQALKRADRAPSPPGQAPEAEPRTAAPAPAARPASPPRSTAASAASGRSAADWLAQNGLAWLGSGALALGGLLLVAYAARRGMFTPAMRIVAAAVLGVLALAVGEGLRRRPIRAGDNDRLVAALTTAAGAAILYAAIWAAHGLYGFIPAQGAAALLAAVSLVLLALSLLHGEPLGLLAVLGAYAAPAIAGLGAWSLQGLDGYLVLILATGLGAAALRGWGRAGALALAGAGLWGLDRLVTGDATGSAVLASGACLLALGAARWGRSPDPPRAGLGILLTAATVGASVFGLGLWRTPQAAVVLAVCAFAAAAGLRSSRVSLRLLAAPALAALLWSLALRVDGAPARPESAGWIMIALAALAAAGWDGARRPSGGALTAAIGAGAAALALTIADPAWAAAFPLWRAPLQATFCALLALGALGLARRAPAPSADLAVAAFVGAAAEVAGLSLHGILPATLAPSGYATLGLALAVLAWRIGWRGLAESAAAAALASFAALLAPAIAGAVLRGDASAGMTMLLAALVPAVLIQASAWRLLKARGDIPGPAEAISTLAVMSALLGAFLVLRLWASPPDPSAAAFGPFVEAALRTLLLLAAGLALAVRGSASPFGRWRAPALLTLGAAHGLVAQGLVLHPWWGAAPRPVLGPPILDALALGLLAPGAILALAARRIAGVWRALAAPAAIAALAFAVLWTVSELRRLFHGPRLDLGPLGFPEAAAYAAAALGWGLLLLAAKARAGKPLAAALALAADGFVGAALLIAAVLLGLVASPWWGPLAGALHDPGLLLALYGLSVGMGLWIARMARRAGLPILADGPRAAALLELFAAVTLMIRYGFHGAAMRARLAQASLETWTFSAVWALYGLAVLAAGARAGDRPLRWLGLLILLSTTAKVFLFDMARLDGVVRAASFLALGAALLVAALAARRLGAAAPGPD